MCLFGPVCLLGSEFEQLSYSTRVLIYIVMPFTISSSFQCNWLLTQYQSQRSQARNPRQAMRRSVCVAHVASMKSVGLHVSTSDGKSHILLCLTDRTDKQRLHVLLPDVSEQLNNLYEHPRLFFLIQWFLFSHQGNGHSPSSTVVTCKSMVVSWKRSSVSLSHQHIPQHNIAVSHQYLSRPLLFIYSALSLSISSALVSLSLTLSSRLPLGRLPLSHTLLAFAAPTLSLWSTLRVKVFIFCPIQFYAFYSFLYLL